MLYVQTQLFLRMPAAGRYFVGIVSKMSFAPPWQPPTDNITCSMLSKDMCIVYLLENKITIRAYYFQVFLFERRVEINICFQHWPTGGVWLVPSGHTT